MSLFNVFNISGSAMNAETIRLNATASNLANAESVNGDATKVYRARHPVFAAMMDSESSLDDQAASAGVRVLGVVESTTPPLRTYQPDHPLADKDGYVYTSNVNSIEEMTNMISANRSFSTNVLAVNTVRVTLGGAGFLTLMLAQLQNQDPTSPVDSNEFLSQLASLSEVQGITQLNSSFAALSTSLVSGQALQASSLLGHQALVASSTASLGTAGGTINGAVSVPQTSSSVVLNITNSAGVLVQSINLGAQSAGLANFSWNGQTSSGSAAPAGAYTLSAQVSGVSGGTAVTTLVSGTVDSVTMGSGTTGLTLNIAGLGSVPFSSVQQISN